MSSDPLDALEVGEVEHQRGCPASTHKVGEEGSRIERFEVDVPTVPLDYSGQLGMRRMQTTRCCDCGAQTVDEVPR
jgi:hypothetical protein